MQDFQIRDKIHPNQTVKIIVKDETKNYSGIYIEGRVKNILTATPEHYRGIKVELDNGAVGRIQEIIKKKK